MEREETIAREVERVPFKNSRKRLIIISKRKKKPNL